MAEAHRGVLPSPEQAVGGLMEGHETAMSMVANAMLKEARPFPRFIAKRIPGIPGLVLDITNFLTADDKLRAGFGLAGSAGGGALGGLVGGPIAPVTAAAGAVAGDKIATDFYDDHKAEIRRQMNETARWIRARQYDVATGGSRALDAFTLGLDHGPADYPSPRTY